MQSLLFVLCCLFTCLLSKRRKSYSLFRLGMAVFHVTPSPARRSSLDSMIKCET